MTQVYFTSPLLDSSQVLETPPPGELMASSGLFWPLWAYPRLRQTVRWAGAHPHAHTETHTYTYTHAHTSLKKKHLAEFMEEIKPAWNT